MSLLEFSKDEIFLEKFKSPPAILVILIFDGFFFWL